uniref:Translocon-associated protein subunit delta n=1 Tax=Acanthochromis polyacanthus TaxID=80966 RepID=A0A3Q1FDE5_9TELE
MMIRIAAFLVLLVAACSGESCTDPVITPSAYTTSDAVISSESVFIVELSLTCANGAQSVTLYADVNGRQFPVTRGQDVGKYQVSWSLPHKQASSGTYQVKFFDEESYSALRKAQRNNEDVNAIQPLFSVNIDHRVSLLQNLSLNTRMFHNPDARHSNNSHYLYNNNESHGYFENLKGVLELPESAVTSSL